MKGIKLYDPRTWPRYRGFTAGEEILLLCHVLAREEKTKRLRIKTSKPPQTPLPTPAARAGWSCDKISTSSL